MINCDANACYGILPEVSEALSKWDVAFGNPSAIHRLGQRARAILEEARAEIASLMQLNSSQRIVFTSGATEAINQALFYPIWNLEQRLGTFVSSATEHPATLETFKKVSKLGHQVKIFDHQHSPNFSSSEFLKYVEPETTLVSLMLANNETGLIYPVADVFKQVKKISSSIFTVCDAVQALGKLEINYSEMEADFIAISGHKIGALSGIGALIVNDHLPAQALISGGPQELSWRAGTENIIGAFSFGVAAKVMKNKFQENQKQYRLIRENLISELKKNLPHVKINNEGQESLFNTLSLQFPAIKADDLVVALDLAGIAVSSGSACASGKPSPSHVLLAIGKTEAEARSTIRISFRPDLTLTEQNILISNLVRFLAEK